MTDRDPSDVDCGLTDLTDLTPFGRALGRVNGLMLTELDDAARHDPVIRDATNYLIEQLGKPEPDNGCAGPGFCSTG